MLSTLATWGFLVGTASLAVMVGIFVAVMRHQPSGTQLTGWRKTVLHPANYLRITGIAYGVAGVSYLLQKIF